MSCKVKERKIIKLAQDNFFVIKVNSKVNLKVKNQKETFHMNELGLPIPTSTGWALSDKN